MIRKISIISILFTLLFTPLTIIAQDRAVYISHKSKTNSNKVYKITEIRATPIHGMDTFYEKVKGDIKKSFISSGQVPKGTIFVRFIIEKDSSLSNISIIRGIGGCDTEVIECIKQSKWKPGHQFGKPVRVQKTISIRLD